MEKVKSVLYQSINYKQQRKTFKCLWKMNPLIILKLACATIQDGRNEEKTQFFNLVYLSCHTNGTPVSQTRRKNVQKLHYPLHTHTHTKNVFAFARINGN